MGFRPDRYVAAAAAVIAIVLVGEACVYAPGVHEFGCEAGWSDGSWGFSASSDGSDAYAAVLLDRGGRAPVTGLYIYVDDHYGELYAQAPPGVRHLDQAYAENQLREALRIRGFEDVESGGADGLTRYMEGGSEGRGVFSMSFALPSEAYDGTEGSPMVEWVRAGGTLYWQGSEVGRWISDGGRLREAPEGGRLFVGSAEVNPGGVPLPEEAVASGGLTAALSLKNGGLDFAVRASAGSPPMLQAGYARDGWCSASLVECGDGAVCVLGGRFTFEMTDDAAQLIASGLTPRAAVLEAVEGRVVRGTASGSIPCAEPDGTTLYIYIGGFMAKHGGAFHG